MPVDPIRKVIRRALKEYPTLNERIDGFRLTVRILTDADYRRDRRNEQLRITPLIEIFSSLRLPQKKTDGKLSKVLIEGSDLPAYVYIQATTIVAMIVAGYRPVVLLYARRHYIERLYKALGVKDFIYYVDHLNQGKHPLFDKYLAEMTAAESLTSSAYRGAAIGKHICSMIMRQTRCGLEGVLSDANRGMFEGFLQDALAYTDAAISIFSGGEFKEAYLAHRGYLPTGPVFDIALHSGIKPITAYTGHRDSVLVVKRYSLEHHNVSPYSVTPENWQKLATLPWNDEDWQELERELIGCYESEKWFGEVGTQVGKSFYDEHHAIDYLGLDPSKKIAVIFAHLFWDATFFFGEDLFADYKDWFVETVRHACANDRVNWVVKVHPANATKNFRDGFTGPLPEIEAIKSFVGSLPSHVRVIGPEDKISTHSLFPIMSYCLTVRGTIGMEAASFGIPVLTAGTGRYDRLGFTVDSDSREGYVRKLAGIEKIPPLNDTQTRSARQFLDAILLGRSVNVDTFRFNYKPDISAEIIYDFIKPLGGNPEAAKDIKNLSDWILSGELDYFDPEYVGGAFSPKHKGGVGAV